MKVNLDVGSCVDGNGREKGMGRKREWEGLHIRDTGSKFPGERNTAPPPPPFFCPSIIRNYEFWSNGQRCIWKVNASRGIYNFAISPVASEERVEELYIKMRSIFEGDFRCPISKQQSWFIILAWPTVIQESKCIIVIIDGVKNYSGEGSSVRFL